VQLHHLDGRRQGSTSDGEPESSASCQHTGQPEHQAGNGPPEGWDRTTVLAQPREVSVTDESSRATPCLHDGPNLGVTHSVVNEAEKRIRVFPLEQSELISGKTREQDPTLEPLGENQRS